MKPERLQEIKKIAATIEKMKPSFGSGLFLELITAYEEAQAELAEKQTTIDNLNIVLGGVRAELAVCKNNLSLALDRDMETQEKLESSDEKLVDALATIAALRKQLAECRAEVARLQEKCGMWERRTDWLDAELKKSRMLVQRLGLA